MGDLVWGLLAAGLCFWPAAAVAGHGWLTRRSDPAAADHAARGDVPGYLVVAGMLAVGGAFVAGLLLGWLFDLV